MPTATSAIGIIRGFSRSNAPQALIYDSLCHLSVDGMADRKPEATKRLIPSLDIPKSGQRELGDRRTLADNCLVEKKLGRWGFTGHPNSWPIRISQNLWKYSNALLPLQVQHQSDQISLNHSGCLLLPLGKAWDKSTLVFFLLLPFSIQENVPQFPHWCIKELTALIVDVC